MNGQVELNSLRKKKETFCLQHDIPQYTAKRFGRAIVQKVYSQHSNV